MSVYRGTIKIKSKFFYCEGVKQCLLSQTIRLRGTVVSSVSSAFVFNLLYQQSLVVSPLVLHWRISQRSRFLQLFCCEGVLQCLTKWLWLLISSFAVVLSKINVVVNFSLFRLNKIIYLYHLVRCVIDIVSRTLRHPSTTDSTWVPLR